MSEQPPLQRHLDLSLDFWNTVNTHEYKLREIPVFIPGLENSLMLEFWRGVKRKMVEGEWVAGKWMPGPLWYYMNMHPILLEDPKSAGLKEGLPLCRDIDWNLFLLYEEARGFSGFKDDPVYTCNRSVGPERHILEKIGIFDTMKDILYFEEDLKKTYVDARAYLRKIHRASYGKPLYQNEAKNFMTMQGRGGGKSYGVSGMLSHNFITGGVTDYDDYLYQLAQGITFSSQSVIAAHTSNWSSPLMDKTLYGYNNMTGRRFSSTGKMIPSPVWSPYKGSSKENEDIVNLVNGSMFYHRVLRNNPLAANAGRPNLTAIDEVGFVENLVATIGAIEGSGASRIFKRNVIIMLGTGGLSSKGVVRYVEPIFRNPKVFNCLEFDDEFEHRGKICHFVSILLTRNKHKEGTNHITNLVTSEKEENYNLSLLDKSPEEKKVAHVVNNPTKPSHMFMSVDGGTFPVFQLRNALAELLGGSTKKYLTNSFKGFMEVTPGNGNVFLAESITCRPIRAYPLGNEENKKGCVEIFQKPILDEHGKVASRVHIAGIDVVDKSFSTTDSLPSIIIMNRYTRQIVAEYTGRTLDPKFFYEQCRRLLIYYNAKAMYEQNLLGLYNHFEFCRSLPLLADMPHQLRSLSNYKEGTNAQKGTTATTNVIREGIGFINSMLMEMTGTGYDQDNNVITTQMYQTIPSPAILEELIQYNGTLNCDRVSALIMLAWFDQTDQAMRLSENIKKRSQALLNHPSLSYLRKKDMASAKDSLHVQLMTDSWLEDQENIAKQLYMPNAI